MFTVLSPILWPNKDTGNVWIDENLSKSQILDMLLGYNYCVYDIDADMVNVKCHSVLIKDVLQF